MFGEVPKTKEELIIKWIDYALRGISIILIVGTIAWFAHQSYYEYVKAGVVKASGDKKLIEEFMKQ